jgi:hypothetical protein
MKIQDIFYPRIIYIYTLIYILLSVISSIFYKIEILSILIFILLFIYSLAVFFIIGYKRKEDISKLSFYCFSYILAIQVLVYIITFFIQNYITKPWLYFKNQSGNFIITRIEYFHIVISTFIVDILIFEIMIIIFLLLGRYFSQYSKER